MKRLLIGSALAIVVATVAGAVLLFRDRPAPSGHPSGYRVTVTVAVRSDRERVVLADIETRPGSRASIRPDRGILGDFATRPGGPAGPSGFAPPVRLTVFADHARGPTGKGELVKFFIRLEQEEVTLTGPLPEGSTGIADLLTLSLESGDYKDGDEPVVAKYKGVTYRLVVK